MLWQGSHQIRIYFSQKKSHFRFDFLQVNVVIIIGRTKNNIIIPFVFISFLTVFKLKRWCYFCSSPFHDVVDRKGEWRLLSSALPLSHDILQSIVLQRKKKIKRINGWLFPFWGKYRAMLSKWVIKNQRLHPLCYYFRILKV